MDVCNIGVELGDMKSQHGEGEVNEQGILRKWLMFLKQDGRN